MIAGAHSREEIGDERSVAFVVLAAGSSRRFGGDKLDADLGGKALGKWATDNVELVTDAHRFIVINPRVPVFATELKDWHFITNPEFENGIGSSIHSAVDALRDYDRIVFTLADMPFVEASLLAKLRDGSGAVFTEQVDGKPGPPAGFPKEHFDKLSHLPGDRGAAFIANCIDFSLVSLNSNDHLTDVDTRDDLTSVRIGAKVDDGRQGRTNGRLSMFGCGERGFGTGVLCPQERAFPVQSITACAFDPTFCGLDCRDYR